MAPSICSTTAFGAAATWLVAACRRRIPKTSARVTHRLRTKSIRLARSCVSAARMGPSSLRAARNSGLPPRLLAFCRRTIPVTKRGGGPSIFTRAAKLGKAFLQMLGQQWQSEQIGGGALVASARGIVPLIHGSIAPAEPCQGNEIDLLILIERADERRQLFIDRIVGLVLEHVDHPVVRRIGPGFRIADA